ncbi:hypothetical protein ATERTT37_000523 [Aspergillus terreus]
MNLLNFAKAVALATALANSAVLAATSGTCSETQRFCGTTEEFCGAGCQSGCDDVVQPFAGIDTSSSRIITTYDHDDEYMRDLVALKKKKPSLEVFISVGGWDLGGEPFSDMVRFSGTRKAFIGSATSFMEEYGFDGIDIDWEYPAASDRGGTSADTENFVTFLKELKAACGDTYQITATLPSSYWYLKGFDIKGMSQYVDHFNFMSYDIHGTWDGNSEYTSSVVNPHTNISEIADGLNLLWRNNIDPAKVLLGLGFYGRSFTLKDTTCTTPGCPFDKSAYEAGGATPGKCTGTSGILSNYEINRVLEQYSPDVIYSDEAAVNWITWNENQWVSFDNAKTLKQKADFANSKCIGGLFAWALDEGGPGSLGDPNDLDPSDTSMSGAKLDGGSDGSGDIYIDQSVLDPDSNTATAIAPANLIVAPSTLSTMTTFTIEPLVTPIEIAWTTTKTVTVSGAATVTTTVTRIVETTTFAMPTITTNVINWWNWNLTQANLTQSTTTLFPSVTLEPIVFQDSSNDTNGTFPVGTAYRTLYPPPWPWSTTSLPIQLPTPTITFTQGPPGPTCTAGCGTKCSSYCDTPCLICDDPKANEGWKDPADPKPPRHSKCSGPDCRNNQCVGPLCVKKGCTGDDCDPSSSACLGSRCEETGCRGSGCGDDGECTGSDCQKVGCYGNHCIGGTGLCLSPGCISLGCIGPLCDKVTGECSGPDCHKVSCSGQNCRNGVCTGEGCEPGESDCETNEADICTEYISSSLEPIASTYTTTTSTSCQTITACDAEPTTTTTTISGHVAAETPYKYYHWTLDKAVASSVASSIEKDLSSLHATTTSTTTSSTTTKTTSTTASTTTDAFSPAETELSCKDNSWMCGHFTGGNFRAFCDVAKSYLRGNEIYGFVHH